MDSNTRLFNEKYFESSPYGRQDPKIIERNYKNLLEKGLKYLPEISSIKKIRILDFGCAYGVGANYLSNRFKDGVIVGIDISEYAIQKARKIYSNKRKLIFYSLDLSKKESLDFLINEHGHFDMIFTRDVLEHIAKEWQEITLKHLSLLLKKGGVIIASIGNGLNPYSYICDRTHIGLRPPYFWKKIFNKYMKVVKCFEKQWIPFI